MKTEKTKVLATRVPASLSKRVRLIALQRDIPASELIRVAVIKEIERPENRKSA